MPDREETKGRLARLGPRAAMGRQETEDQRVRQEQLERQAQKVIQALREAREP